MIAHADLHVHSKFSGISPDWYLRLVNSAESYSEVDTIFFRALKRGQTFVTVTDHDQIMGSLRLKEIYPARVFTGVEFNVYFPEGYNLQECGQPSFVTEETIKKRAKSIKEKYNDPVYREKHRLSMLGVKKTLRQPRKPFSEETKRKISEGNKGKKGNTNPRPDLIEYNKTREWTDEMRGKISKLNKGKKWTPELREKILKSRKENAKNRTPIKRPDLAERNRNRNKYKEAA